MIRFKKSFPLSRVSSYRIGGAARYFFEAGDIRELEEALRAAKKKKLKIFVVGGGTNLLVGERGFDGLVLRPALSFIRNKGTAIEVGAGTPMEKLLKYTIEKKLGGLEWAGGLPGTVGGAIRGNAGAFGGEMKDLVQTVHYLDINDLRLKTRNATECLFGYRMSIFKEKGNRDIIIHGTLKLTRGNAITIKEAIEEKITYRKLRHPMEYPNIGSIFKNVPVQKIPRKLQKKLRSVVKKDPFPVVPAAYLIAESALKGVSFGGAMISPQHPNFIVNALEATSTDVKYLMTLIRNKVFKKFGIMLEPEIIEL